MKPSKRVEIQESGKVLPNLLNKAWIKIMKICNNHGASVIQGTSEVLDAVHMERKTRFFSTDTPSPACSYSLSTFNFQHEIQVLFQNRFWSDDDNKYVDSTFVTASKYHDAKRTIDLSIHERTYNHLEIHEQIDATDTPSSLTPKFSVHVSSVEFDSNKSPNFTSGGGPFCTLLTQFAMIVASMNRNSLVIMKACVYGTSDEVFTDGSFPFDEHTSVPDNLHFSNDCLNSDVVQYICKPNSQDFLEEPIKENIITLLLSHLQNLASSPTKTCNRDLESVGKSLLVSCRAIGFVANKKQGTY